MMTDDVALGQPECSVRPTLLGRALAVFTARGSSKRMDSALQMLLRAKRRAEEP